MDTRVKRGLLLEISSSIPGCMTETQALWWMENRIRLEAFLAGLVNERKNMDSTKTHEVLARDPQLRKVFLRKKGRNKVRGDEGEVLKKTKTPLRQMVRISAQDGL